MKVISCHSLCKFYTASVVSLKSSSRIFTCESESYNRSAVEVTRICTHFKQFLLFVLISASRSLSLRVCVCLWDVCIYVCAHEHMQVKISGRNIKEHTITYSDNTFYDMHMREIHSTHINTHTHAYRHLRPSLRASTMSSMASPIIAFLSSSCALIGCWMGEAHCRGRNEGRGSTHTHNQPPTYTLTHTHTYRESLLFAVHHASSFQLHTAVKLFTTQPGLNAPCTRYDEVVSGRL